jgi:hypothetical protein
MEVRTVRGFSLLDAEAYKWTILIVALRPTFIRAMCAASELKQTV